jgi:NAD dependent epimerase/dehydratase family enzyme
MSALGVINGTAPNPVRLSELCEQLGNVLGRPSWLPVPDFALKAVLGEGATVVRSHLWLTCPPFHIYSLRSFLQETIYFLSSLNN